MACDSVSESALRPLRTPSLSASCRFWLSLNLPMIEAISISMPTMPRACAAMNGSGSARRPSAPAATMASGFARMTPCNASRSSTLKWLGSYISGSGAVRRAPRANATLYLGIQQPGVNHGLADNLAGRGRHRHQRQANLLLDPAEQLEPMLGAGKARLLEHRVVQRHEPVLDLQRTSEIALERGHHQFGAEARRNIGDNRD